VVEKNSRVGHENLRKLIMTDEEWREKKGKDAEPYKPQLATLLDLEAYYWHRRDSDAFLLVREDPNAPLPSNPLVAVRAVLPTDEKQAEAAIEQIEAALRACDAPLVNPARFAELVRMWDRQSREASVEYTRKRARRKPKDGKGRKDDGT
jgi:hypothetical protein